MAQYSNGHLTTAQLSAYLDEELTKDELALCDAHLQTCSRCQGVLADLRVTSTLLHRMPQVDVPRSFVLPPNIAVLPAAPSERRAPRRGQPPLSQYIVRRSLRTLSTLAAVVGLLFILVGALSSLPRGGYATSTASNAPVSNGVASGAANTPPALGTHNSATPPEYAATLQAASANATARAQHRQAPPATPAVAPTASTPGEKPGVPVGPPAVLDLGQTEGRLSIGAALLVLGILGVLLTRRSRREAVVL